LALGQTQEALGRIERSVRLSQELSELSDDLEERKSLRALGQALVAKGEYGSAVATFQHSLSLLAGRDPCEAARAKAAWECWLASGADIERSEALLRELAPRTAR